MTSTTRRRLLAAASEQLLEAQAREELRRELREAGYPANAFIRDIAAGHPLQVVLRRYGYDPIGRTHPRDRHPSGPQASTVAQQLLNGFRRTGR